MEYHPTLFCPLGVPLLCFTCKLHLDLKSHLAGGSTSFLMGGYGVIGVLVEADDHGFGGGVARVDGPVLEGGLEKEIYNVVILIRAEGSGWGSKGERNHVIRISTPLIRLSHSG